MLDCFSCCTGEDPTDKALREGSIHDFRGMTLTSFANISLKSDSNRRKYIAEEVGKFGKGNISARAFTFQELNDTTHKFNPDFLLGEGGFGKDIAVKQLDRNGFQGNREFLVEVLLLSLLHHPNLVNLIGYCCDGEERILVYEFLENGCLEDHLLELQAQPLFKDKQKFHLMVDPLLQGNYPTKGLYQALAVAAMCLQEEADTRPFISDVVTALEFLSGNKKAGDEGGQEEEGAAKSLPPGSESNVYKLESSEPAEVREKD
nr:probable serine/threonine-protein kinase PBL23 [Ipomoea batatas]